MCFDADSHPPIEPISGGALEHGSDLLSTSDGQQIRAFHATPTQPTGAGILVLPDVRGLHGYYEELALRFAEHGIAAVAIDFFARTAGNTGRGDDFDYTPHVQRLTWDGLQADVTAGVAKLRSLEPAPRSMFVTGFCMGGRLASLATTLGFGFAGAIAFYGWPVGPHRSGMPAPADLAKQIECSILAIYGGADQGITAEIRNEFDQALDAAGKDHRTIVYPGAPHSFFDRKAAEFQDASDAAWTETLGFIRKHTAGQPIAAG
jgi:carboxymethylenebutenolidase